jgi:hypothetical protein
MSRERDLELVLTSGGGAELIQFTGEDGKPVWASDSDEGFMEDFPEFLGEADTERIMDYLIEQEIITEDEADNLEISLESLNNNETEVSGDFDDGDDLLDDIGQETD